MATTLDEPNATKAAPAGAAEADLVQALKRGEAAAYEQLVREQSGRMLAVARRLLGEEADAQDAVQEAFLSAFKAIGRFAGGSKLSTWLHRITVNAALMRIRARKRRPEQSIDELLPRFEEDGHPVEPAVQWRSADELLASAETRALVREQIQQLPETYRHALVLRDIEGLDTRETAELLGITPNAVKIRLHRARQALRTLLDPHLRDEDKP